MSENNQNVDSQDINQSKSQQHELTLKGIIVVSSIFSFGFLINEYSKSRYQLYDQSYYQSDILFYACPNKFRCRDGLLFLDWMLIISILGSYFKPDLVDKSVNFILLLIRTIISIIFLSGIGENCKIQLYQSYFNVVVKNSDTDHYTYDYTEAAYLSYSTELYLFIVLTICGIILFNLEKNVDMMKIFKNKYPLVCKGVLLIGSLLSFIFLIIEYSKSRYKTNSDNDYYQSDTLFYSYPNYFRCRDGLMFLDWMLILSILGSHFKPELIEKKLNFVIIGIRTIVSIIFLWDINENWKSQIHSNYFTYVVSPSRISHDQYDFIVAAFNSYVVEIYTLILLTISAISLFNEQKDNKSLNSNKEPLLNSD